MVSANGTNSNPFDDTLVSTCDAPSKFVWWDGLHPTAAVHKVIAAEVAPVLEALL
jgi:phospholipase/lecithinase/hemolysin